MSKKLIFVNQTANYLFADIIHAFAERLPEYELEAWYGTFDYDIVKLPRQVRLAKGPEYDRNGFVPRVKSWLAFYFWMRKQLRATDKSDTQFFFVSNPPLFVFLPGLKQLDYVCLIYDLYPDVLAGIKDSVLKKSITSRWQKVNRKVLPRAQKIFTIGEGLRTAIQQYLSVAQQDNVEVIPVWNKSTVGSSPASDRDFKKEWQLEGKQIILYSGNIGLTHPLEHLVTIAEQLQDNEEWHVVIVGMGSKKQKLQEQAKGMKNISFHEPVPFADLPQLLSIATWGYVTLDTAATNTSVPSKTFNLLAAGIPILALVNETSEIAKLIDKYDTGIYFKEQEIPAVIEKITATNNQQLKTYSENAVSCSTHFTAALAHQFVDSWIGNNVS